MDLNGTLVDAFQDLTDALNVILASHGRAVLSVDQVRPWSGEGLRTLLRQAFRATGTALPDPELGKLLQSFRTVYESHLGRLADLYPDVAETLASLSKAGVRMSILTNKPETPSLKLLEHMGIGHYFEYLVAGDGAAHRKPDPSGLLQLMEQMGASAAQTLMVGSTRIDLETARNAGVRCAVIAQDPGASVRGLGAEYVLDSMPMLVALATGTGTGGA